MNKFIDATTIFLIIILIGVYIGSVYGIFGGAPTLSYAGLDGRKHFLYLTTSTPANSVFGGFFRPAGIYDEPGALSFFISSICLLRVLYRRNENATCFLLITGLITFSVTHILIFACYLLYYISKYRKKRTTAVYIVFGVILITLLIATFYDFFDMYLFSRLKYDPQRGTIAGDSRSHLFRNGFKYLNVRHILFGGDITAYTDMLLYSHKFPAIGENPLSQLLYYGIFSCWYYYVFLGIILFAGFCKPEYFFIFCGVCALYLQRPYPEIIGYSFYFILFTFCALSTIKESLLKNRIYFCLGK
jgi:hypothetical protein